MITNLKHDLISGRFQTETSPVVLACITKRNESKKIVSMLEQFSLEMEDQVHVFIADEEIWGLARNELKLEGTPVFIFYFHGKEKYRILGNTTSKYLKTATKNILKNLKTQEIS